MVIKPKQDFRRFSLPYLFQRMDVNFFDDRVKERLLHIFAGAVVNGIKVFKHDSYFFNIERVFLAVHFFSFMCSSSLSKLATDASIEGIIVRILFSESSSTFMGQQDICNKNLADLFSKFIFKTPYFVSDSNIVFCSIAFAKWFQQYQVNLLGCGSCLSGGICTFSIG